MVCCELRVEDDIRPPMAQRKKLLKVHLGGRDFIHRLSKKIIFQTNAKTWKRVVRYVRGSCVVVVGLVSPDMQR